MPPFGRLPKTLQTPAAGQLYKSLCHKRGQLFCKRVFDIVGAVVLLVLLSPLLLGVGLWVQSSSAGGVFFCQQRIGRFGKPFAIIKFRTMIAGSEAKGQITQGEDDRITPCGVFLRRSRLDEIPQLVNILRGEMSFVGPRPEVPRFVACYNEEQMATLLLPVGLTCPASIRFREEGTLLAQGDAEEQYRTVILPEKMAYNIAYAQGFSFLEDIHILWQTMARVWGRNRDGI